MRPRVASEPRVDALLSPAGQTILAELSAADVAPEHEIRTIARLRERHAPELVRLAVAQVALRQRARAKFTRADEMLFTRPGLEQASSERMARHHAARYAPADARVADLCCGIGGDLIGLAAHHQVAGVDRDPVHARLARHNADVNGMGASVRIACADVRDVRLSPDHAVFIDPARRTESRRLRAGESEPPLEWCFECARGGRAVGIKAGPTLSADAVPAGWEMELVSEGRELKETLLWSTALATGARRATVLGRETHSLVEAAGAEVPIAAPGAFLLDVDPAVTRAGLVDELGVLLGRGGACWKIDARIGFLSCDVPTATPFGRLLRVEESMPWNLKRLGAALRTLGIGRVDIRKRGSAVDVDAVQRALRLRGDRAATVVLTRVHDRPWAFVCSEVDGQQRWTCGHRDLTHKPLG